MAMYLSFVSAGTPRALRTQNLKGSLTRESSAAPCSPATKIIASLSRCESTGSDAGGSGVVTVKASRHYQARAAFERKVSPRESNVHWKRNNDPMSINSGAVPELGWFFLLLDPVLTYR